MLVSFPLLASDVFSQARGRVKLIDKTGAVGDGIHVGTKWCIFSFKFRNVSRVCYTQGMDEKVNDAEHEYKGIDWDDVWNGPAAQQRMQEAYDEYNRIHRHFFPLWFRNFLSRKFSKK
jgi:hypothetical protein